MTSTRRTLRTFDWRPIKQPIRYPNSDIPKMSSSRSRGRNYSSRQEASLALANAFSNALLESLKHAPQAPRSSVSFSQRDIPDIFDEDKDELFREILHEDCEPELSAEEKKQKELEKKEQAELERALRLSLETEEKDRKRRSDKIEEEVQKRQRTQPPSAPSAPSAPKPSNNSENPLQCHICCSEEKNAIVMPCRHCFCSGCAARAVAAKRCHNCNAQVTSSIDIHL